MDRPSFKFGVEHESALASSTGWLDFATLSVPELDAIVDRLPFVDADYPGLRRGNMGIKVKRWYIEGLERFGPDGEFVRITPKGLETRTPISDSIDDAVRVLWDDRERLRRELAGSDMALAEIAFNPWRTSFEPDPPFNAYELANREMTIPEAAGTYMLTYGPDLNLSSTAFDTARVIDLGHKLVHYSPFLVPFSFSSPFYDGTLWPGYSVRTWYRCQTRPAALVYVDPAVAGDHPDDPVHAARIPAEDGRIEFKAFDTVRDPDLYRSLLALIKGVCLDDTLAGRADASDVRLHRLAASGAFDESEIRAGSQAVVDAARAALAGDPDASYLDRLESMLAERRTPAHALIERHKELGDILATIQEC